MYSPASIVLVTEEPAPPTPPTPDQPGDETDPEFSPGAAALGVVLGTAGLGYITYAHISSLYLYYTLPGGFIPSTRQELANVLWTTAGKPDPVSTALYTDIPADAIEQQKAARWCVEQGLLSDHGATFGPDTKVTNARIIRAWNSLKKSARDHSIIILSFILSCTPPPGLLPQAGGGVFTPHLLCQKGCCHCHRLALGVLRAGGAVLGQ